MRLRFRQKLQPGGSTEVRDWKDSIFPIEICCTFEAFVERQKSCFREAINNSSHEKAAASLHLPSQSFHLFWWNIPVHDEMMMRWFLDWASFDVRRWCWWYSSGIPPTTFCPPCRRLLRWQFDSIQIEMNCWNDIVIAERVIWCDNVQTEPLAMRDAKRTGSRS